MSHYYYNPLTENDINDISDFINKKINERRTELNNNLDKENKRMSLEIINLTKKNGELTKKVELLDNQVSELIKLLIEIPKFT